jgi:hypothetical protein
MAEESLGYFAETVRGFFELSPVFRSRKWEIIAIFKGRCPRGSPLGANGLIPQHSIAQNADALDLELDDVARFEEAHLLETATVADRA